MLNNDRPIIISAAGSRKATQWPPQNLYWSDLVERLRTPTRGTETLDSYMALPKSKQDDLKDVGGFVGGTLQGNRRKANSVTGRDVITLDLDNIQPGYTQDTIRRIVALGCACVIYSTRKHSEAKPRLRVLVPTNRTITSDEYQPIARKLASIIGIELSDPTTFEASRLMYWPSCCIDSQYVYLYEDKPFLHADGLLATYSNWRNVAEWPEVPGVQQAHTNKALKQEDPTTKDSVIGAFCRTYDIYKAIETFLPEEYILSELDSTRFTYAKGSTVNGAIVYENGKFLYSNHGSDPAGGKLCNAFDLVRLHKFSSLDDEAKPDTPPNRLPSYISMCQLAMEDKCVSLLLSQERYEKATQEFSIALEDNDPNWMVRLEKNTTGSLMKTIKNMRIIMENDPVLKGKIGFDEFSNKGLAIGSVPWDPTNKKKEWGNSDDSGLREYLQAVHKVYSPSMYEDALGQAARKNIINEVKDYLISRVWDGIKRLDTLFIDYLGATDNIYVRTVTRKSIVAAVARVMTPGIKHDEVLILTGPQGIGKSTILRDLGRSWFSDNVKTFEGKEAAELIQGLWIIELGELN